MRQYGLGSTAQGGTSGSEVTCGEQVVARVVEHSSENDPAYEPANDSRYEALQRIAWWDQARLRAARVLVVGAGALGNEVLKNLALLGIGRIMVVDFDRVERSNLSRSVLYRTADDGQPKAVVAAQRIAELNADVAVRPVVGNVMTDVGLGWFRDADVVLGCLDNREARLWVNRSCRRVGRLWIDGAIEELNGVVRVFAPDQGPCYECGLTEADYRDLQRRYSCPLLSDEELRSGRVPTTPTIASVVGAWQVQEAIKHLHAMAVPVGKALVFNGVSSQSYITALPTRSDCLAHERYDPVETVDLTHQAEVGALFEEVSTRLGTRRLVLRLDRPLVTRASCVRCDLRRRLWIPRVLLRAEDCRCSGCHDLLQLKTRYYVSANSRLCRRRLAELGIPDYDIVCVGHPEGETYYQLAAQESWP
jgi:molybdopterin/thiamine biosynthesis adenylyltransferase